MILTANQLQKVLETRLKEAGLAQFIDRERSQFLDLDGEVFAEIVLSDASRLGDAQQIVDLTTQEMKSQGILLDSVVRALWEIVSLEYSGPSHTPDLTQRRAAEEFRALLRSAGMHCQVIVDVSWGAIEILRHELGIKESSDVRELIIPVVRQLLERNLSHGGTSYWNPIGDSRLDLTATDMSFLLGQSTAFEELRQAVSDAFEPPVLDSFLGSLSVSDIKIDDYDAVLPEFSNMLGGAYRRGDTFSTSASDLYRRLNRTEQELLRKYFQGKVDQLKTDPRFGSLLKKYPQVFAPVRRG